MQALFLTNYFSIQNKRVARLGLMACGLLCCLSTFAAEQLSFNRIGSVDGLPQNTVTAMIQDRHGFVWLGTYDGLHRYDGYEFVSFDYDETNPQSISSDVITDIAEDQEGYLWVGTEQRGLNRLDPTSGEFTRYLASTTQFDGLSHNKVTAVHIDPNNRVWIGTLNGLNLYLPESNSFARFYHNPLDKQSLPNGSISDITDDGDGNLYIATSGGLSRLLVDQQVFERFDRPSDPVSINTLFLDVDQSLWVGTQLDGLYHLPKGDSQFEHFTYNLQIPNSLSANHVRAVLRDSAGNLWVGTEQGGISLKTRVNNGFTHFQRNPADVHSLSINDVWSIMEDRSGQVWIGTAGGGINKTTPRFNNFLRLQHAPFDQNSLSHNFVWNIQQDDTGSIWFATLNGIDRYQPEKKVFEHFGPFIDQNKQPIGNRITTLTLSDSGQLWFGTQAGQVARLDPTVTNHQVELVSRSGFTEEYFSNNRIRLIRHDSRGNIWVASDEGLARLNSTSGEIVEDFRYAPFGQLGDSPVYTLLEDEQGILWFGTLTSGLQRYDPEFKTTQTFKFEDGNPNSLSDETVRSIYQDAQGNLWFGTYNGLSFLSYQNRINNQFIFERFNESDGLPNNTVYGVTSDEAGHIWISTNRGLSRFHPPTKEFKNFTSIDGLPADEFNGNAVLKSTQGMLYFGSVSGVAVIDPSGIVASDYQPNLVITHLKVNNRSLFEYNWQPLESLELDYLENNLQLKFSALDLRLPERNQYLYRLKPIQQDWQSSMGDNQIQYANLDSGDYLFELRATNSDGVWLAKSKQLAIHIAPPFWATWWAYAGYLSLLIALVAGFVRRHNKKLFEQQKINQRLQRNDRLKDEFLANTSHELRTPLNGIIGVAESLREGIAGTLSDKTLHHLSLIIDSAKRLSHQVDEILDFKKLSHTGLMLNLRSVDLRVVGNVVTNLLQPLVADKPVQLTNSLPRFLPHVYADEDRLRQILYNLVGNAIKYTEQGFIEITARIEGERVEICVKDSGCGIPKSKQSTIFKPFEQLDQDLTHIRKGTGLGLAVTRQLVELHRGQLWVKSKPGAGSSFYFTIPIASDQQQALSKQPSYPRQTESVSDTSSMALETVSQADGVIEMQWQPHVLVADDDRLNRQVLTDFLVMRNYQVTEAVDGAEALEKIEQSSFDLVILDVMMPQKSGFEVCQILRQKFSALELPILLLSAKSQPKDIEMGLAVGANDYVSKPMDRTILMARVSNLLMLRQVYQAQQNHLQYLAMEQTFHQLSQYFPRPLIEKLLDHQAGVHTQPERRCVTVLFADIVGFTEFSDRFEPETVADVFNEFLTSMGQAVSQHEGLLNEVLGDGLVVLFGALEPVDKITQAKQALNLASSMQSAIDELAERWRSTGLEQALNLRIGIHQSYSTIGNFGSQELIVFRAVGSGVNLAARIQSTCQPGETKASYPIYAQCRDEFEFEELEQQQFKGFNHSHRIFKLLPQAGFTEKDISVVPIKKG